jgi:hypothetical protein
MNDFPNLRAFDCLFGFRASADKNVGDTAGRNACATLQRMIFGFIFFQFSVSSGYVESERGQPASDL